MRRRWIGWSAGVVWLALGLGCAEGGGSVAAPTPEEEEAPCVPNERSCHDGVARWCRPDGTLDEYACDAEQGLVCAPSGCSGECAHEELGDSYMGCDYLPTVTPNSVWSGFHYAVAVANTQLGMAHVTVRRADEIIESRPVAPSAVEVFVLPWVPELKGNDFSPSGSVVDVTGPTQVVIDGAYRLLSDRPVTVYQLSALEYALAEGGVGCPPAADGTGCYSFSNDSSLLLPSNVLGRDYVTMSWFSSPIREALGEITAADSSGFVSIAATADDTEVWLTAADEIIPGAGLDASGAGKVVLNAGDVLQVIAAAGEIPSSILPEIVFGPDLSGSRVHASKPVSVLAGHRCAFVPSAGTGYCDHLEEAMFPSVTLGEKYVVTAPSDPEEAARWPYVLRVAATHASTRVTFDPPVAGEVVLEPGQRPFELAGLTSDVQVSATGPILVAQYLQGATSLPGGNLTMFASGDPSESLVVPLEQFRNAIIFQTSLSYDQNFVNIVAPAGALVTLDDAPLPSSLFEAVSTTGMTVARVLLVPKDVHTISCDVPIGITVYGYGKYTSYMNPGGLDLKRISEPPPDPPK